MQIENILIWERAWWWSDKTNKYNTEKQISWRWAREAYGNALTGISGLMLWGGMGWLVAQTESNKVIRSAPRLIDM